jgi:hypothetical protein
MAEAWVKRLMLGTDVGFLVYWLATAVHVIPPYPEEVLVDWNWSYLVLDLVASGSGLAALWLARRRHPAGRPLLLVSLALTHSAGLTALNFWVLRDDWAIAWWLPNLWLTLFPVIGLALLIRSGHPVREPGRRVRDGAATPA